VAIKFPIPPDEAGYSFNDGQEVFAIATEGGPARYRKDIIDSTTRVTVKWIVGQDDYTYLRSFYRALSNGAVSFTIDLILDDSIPQTKTAYFVPGSMKLDSQSGYSYNVSAELEVFSIPVFVNTGAIAPIGATLQSDGTVFAIGDGIKSKFQLTLTPGTITRSNDWQGTQKLYSTPRTNLIVRSQEFDNAIWSKTRLTISPNIATGPEGSMTGDKLVEDVSTGEHMIDQTGLSIGDGLTATATIYAQPAGRSWLYLAFVQRDNTGVLGVYFNLTGVGSIGSIAAGFTANIQQAPLTPWLYRCTITGPVGTGINNPWLRCKVATGNNISTHLGDGASGLYLWGADTELGIISASYIPTTNVPVTVTDYTLS
jgi:hypothetical protein